MTVAGDTSGELTGREPALAEALLGRFQGGQWSELADVESMELTQRSDRSTLALVRLASRLQRHELKAVRTAAAEAAAWGVQRSLVGSVMIAGALDDLARARDLRGEVERAESHRVSMRRLTAAVTAAPRPAGVAGEPAATDDYRSEVVRQRKLIAELRSTIHTMRSQGDKSGQDAELVGRILAHRLTYLSPAKMACLARTCRAIEEQQVPGVFIEAGCALGGSAILIASVKKPQRELLVYDVFGMIPAPGADDTPDVHERYRRIVEGRSEGIAGDKYYGYEANLYEVVKYNLERYEIDLAARHVQLVRGLVQDTLTGTGPVAFAHIDLDWYDPVSVCLQRIYPRLSVGGSIVVDDYHDWGGCRRAVDAFLGQVAGSFVTDDSARSLKITKVAEEVSP